MLHRMMTTKYVFRGIGKDIGYLSCQEMQAANKWIISCLIHLFYISTIAFSIYLP